MIARRPASRAAEAHRSSAVARAGTLSVSRGGLAGRRPEDGQRRTVCFVTGTRAEFGLMARTLTTIRAHPRLRLRVVATGMHLDRSRGYSLDTVRAAGFAVDATVPWPATAGRSAAATAAATGRAMAALATQFAALRADDVVLVVGDRVEAFAAAAAAHVANRCVAHVHGGDRAPGVVDDSLRHAVTKLAHVHFPATAASADRIRRLGEDAWRVRRVGSPGLDGIADDAAPSGEVAAVVGPLSSRRYALLALHAAGGSHAVERARATQVLAAVRRAGIDRLVTVYPNNDPGSDGIADAWEALAGDPAGDGGAGGGRGSSGGMTFCRNLPRGVYLGLLRDAAVLVGNSSSGIIEAASFGTPVVDVGPRQHGREHGPNVTHVGYRPREIADVVGRLWRGGDPVRFPRRNLYGTGRAGPMIADTLARVTIGDRLLRKLIAY